MNVGLKFTLPLGGLKTSDSKFSGRDVSQVFNATRAAFPSPRCARPSQGKGEANVNSPNHGPTGVPRTLTAGSCGLITAERDGYIERNSHDVP